MHRLGIHNIHRLILLLDPLVTKGDVQFYRYDRSLDCCRNLTVILREFFQSKDFTDLYYKIDSSEECYVHKS